MLIVCRKARYESAKVHHIYSPDLAPSDALKSRIQGIEFETSDEIKEWIQDGFEKIPPEELRRVFSLWAMRLRACIELSSQTAALE